MKMPIDKNTHDMLHLVCIENFHQEHRPNLMIKRTNLMIDETLLKEAKRLLETDTFSAAVNLALAEAIRLKKVGSLSDLFGKGIWSGNLATMREDNPQPRKSKKHA